jgi:hypothetical protein
MSDIDRLHFRNYDVMNRSPPPPLSLFMYFRILDIFRFPRIEPTEMVIRKYRFDVDFSGEFSTLNTI